MTQTAKVRLGDHTLASMGGEAHFFGMVLLHEWPEGPYHVLESEVSLLGDPYGGEGKAWITFYDSARLSEQVSILVPDEEHWSWEIIEREIYEAAVEKAIDAGDWE